MLGVNCDASLGSMPNALVLKADLLTTAQVARRIGRCRETVLKAVREGRLVAVVRLPGVNGAYLFEESAVVTWRSPGERLPGL